MRQNSYPSQEMEQLLLKCLQGQASEEECQLAWNWIEADGEHLRYYESLRDSWLASGMAWPVPKQQIRGSWQNVCEKIDKPIWQKHRFAFRSNKMMRWSVQAAAVILIFFTGTLYNRITTKTAGGTDDEYFTVESPKGAKSLLTLTDGSRVWLNAGSQIRYSRKFNQHNRDLYLRGEAYFEVAKNKQLPFRVYASGIVVNALGTAFNIKAYPEEKIVETTLVRGLVSIENTNGHTKDKILLKPNQKAAFYKAKRELAVDSPNVSKPIPVHPVALKIERVEIANNVNTEIYTSWKDKRWLFENENLGSFAMKLERQYDISVVFKDQELKQYKLSGTLQEETIDQVLRAIQLTVPIDYKIEHKKVILSVNQSLMENYQKLLKH